MAAAAAEPRPRGGPGAAPPAAARLPRLHVLVGDDLVAGGADRCAAAAAPVLEAGGARLAVQLRARSASGRLLFETARELARAARRAGALLVVNDRADIAMACGAHGVHLREDSLPPGTVREFAPDGMLVGRSIHAPAQAAELDGGGADYLALGAVFPTATHPGRAPIGAGAVAEAAAAGRLPVLAIGGVAPEDAAALVGRGAHGVVAHSGVWGADDPAFAVLRYLDALAAAHGEKAGR